MKGGLTWADSCRCCVDLEGWLLEGWRNEMLVLVVPWVTEVLRMLRYDAVMREGKYYRNVLRVCVAILAELDVREGSAIGMNQNLLFVMLDLEVIVSECAAGKAIDAPPGFAAMISLPSQSSDDETLITSSGGGGGLVGKNNRGVDRTNVYFSKRFLFSCFPALEELHGLVENYGRRRHSSATKKMRPFNLGSRSSVVREEEEGREEEGGGGTGTSKNSVVKELSSPVKRRSSFGGDFVVDGGGAHVSVASDGIKKFQVNLVDIFFHRHRELRKICEVVIDGVVKVAVGMLEVECVQPAVEECIEGMTTEEIKMIQKGRYDNA